MNKFSYQLCKSLHSLTRSPVHFSFRYNWGLSEVNRFTLRQHNCGDLKESDIGKKVTLHGWIKHIRTHGSAVFLVVNDAYGDTQLIFKQSHASISKLPIGSVIKAEGTVTKRPKGQENNKMKTGAIEVLVDQFEVINKRTFPALITKESDRLKYRYIDLRNKAISSNLRLKSQIMNNVRNFFHQEGFIEVETPLLQKHTPGGAHEFIVPTHDHNKFYCLAQSPQIFKQLLMIGGLDRYFQIAKCMRDEVSRPDRQPEFSQIDLEMSFTNTDGIIDLIEALLVAIWPSFAGSITIPFPRISYDQALQKYGSDKPDLRSDIELHDLTTPLEDIIKRPAIGLSIPNGVDENLEAKLYQLSLSVAEDLSFGGKVIGLKINDPDCWTLDREDSVKIDEPIKFCITQKMKLYKGDYLFVAYGDSAEIRRFMGKFRNLGIKCIAENNISNCLDNSFVWIVDFPLFTKNELDGTIESSHHPFSAPKDNQLEKLYSNPLQVVGDQFDLVLNGEEVGGGSMRIHDANVQEYILKDILKVDYSSLQFFLDALRSGAPPHGGIALGLDRLIRIMCNASSIREVIAFPKSFTGKDPLSGGPTELSPSILKSYNIKPT